jgi:hypothetical protein
MLCAFMWWLADGNSELRIPVAVGEFISTQVPPMSFGCPVSALSSGTDETPDDDDPDLPDDAWDETVALDKEE